MTEERERDRMAPGDVPGASGPPPGPGVQRAVRIYRELRALLLEAMRDRLASGARPLTLSFTLQLDPLGVTAASGDPAEREFAEALLARIRGAVDEEVNRRAPFPPGRVRCFWCRSFDCEHARPESPRTVFAGYGPTGLPVWTELATVALERRDPRIDDFYRDPPIPIAIVQAGRDLVRARLPVYGEHSDAYRILGQVSVGYLALRTGSRGERESVALTLQAIEVGRGREVRLNVIGRLADGTDLWRVIEEEPDSRLADALQAARARLIDTRLRARQRGESRERQAMGALGRLARNLERIFRQRERRTKHSQDRHLDRERPAAAALRDAIAARPDEIYRDVRESTWVVLGPRSRVHIFNDAGQHITSVVYPGETVRRRTAQGMWRVAPPDSVRGFREALARSARDRSSCAE